MSIQKEEKLKCPLCGHTEFQQEEGKLDSKWGITAHRVKILVCKNCNYMLHFFKGNTWWDFD